MQTQNNQTKHPSITPDQINVSDQSSNFDYTYVPTPGRIVVYDDLRSAPRIVEIPPNTTAEYIEDISSKTYTYAREAGGKIPYTVIREVSENFIHAQFSEIIVSILDEGSTIRFSDQGPGIPQKDKAQLPGFTSATEHMKPYIRGVGSGLPIVKEYLDFSNGTITIEDNLINGSVVTISTKRTSDKPSDTVDLSGNQAHQPPLPKAPYLTDREKLILSLFLTEGILGVTEVAKLTDMPQSSVYVAFKKLAEHGLIESNAAKKRSLTEIGYQIASNL